MGTPTFTDLAAKQVVDRKAKQKANNTTDKIPIFFMISPFAIPVKVISKFQSYYVLLSSLFRYN
jgi:hypothetical protein